METLVQHGSDPEEPRKWPNPAKKVRLQSDEDQGQEVAGSKLGPSKDFSLQNPNLNYILPLVISIQNNNSFERCIGWLYICFTCERCNMSSINKKSTRV